MKVFLSKRLPRFVKRESGFTLVELLVVVAIIIALAAVIIPSVAAFSGKGEEGAKAAERDNIQTAIDTYMADQGLTVVVANIAALDTSEEDFSTATGTLDLETGGYLRQYTLTYFYCWDTAGLVTNQDTAATLDCTRTN